MTRSPSFVLDSAAEPLPEGIFNQKRRLRMTQSFNYYKHSFIASFIALISSSVGLAQSQTDTGIRTSQPLTILSANDGATHGRLNADGRPDTEHLTLDSITA